VSTGAALRPPLPLDPTAAAYKDWLHVNLLDEATGIIGLLNASLHGDPADPRSRAVGTALLHVPERGWYGNVGVGGLADARVDATSIALEHVAVAVHGEEVLASAQFPGEEVTIDLHGTFAAPPTFADEPLPHGVGWIAWYGVPRIRPAGTAHIAGLALDLRTATAYHDHNWGRWHWGDDFGWEWGCFLPPEPAPALVLTKVTDRAHTTGGSLLLVAYTATRRRAFAGPALSLAWSGMLRAEPRRVPGAVAALHHDRASPQLPQRLTIRADDATDRVELEFEAHAVAQLIAADPAQQGYGFIHELVGSFRYASRLAGQDSSGTGLAVVEYVD
jgi:hypothetical protein